VRPLSEDRQPAADTPSLRLLFCGTPEFALPSLAKLANSRHKLVGVVTVPDRPQGRGRKLKPSAVKTAAAERGHETWQPDRLDNPEFLARVQTQAPDLIVVVAFRILPTAFYSLARLGAVNLHASLLPAYRGAAPIARALMDGCSETGVTTFQIAPRVDTGGILLQRHVAISPNEDAGELSGRLAEAGAELLLETVDGLAAGILTPSPQNDALATRAPKLNADDRPVRWHEPARTSHNRVRALSPLPGATIRRNNKVLKVLETDFDSSPVSEPPGTVLRHAGGDAIAVATGLGTLRIRRLQPEGKPVMKADAYLRGNPVTPGERLA